MKHLYSKRERLAGELDELRAKFESTQDKGLLERLGNVKRGLDAVAKEIVAEKGKSPESREEENVPQATPARAEFGAAGEVRSRALRAIDARSDDLESSDGDRLVDLVERDATGVDAAYIEAISNPAYESGFARMLANPNAGASQLLQPDEAEAVQAVGNAMQMRAMAVGEGATGGFAVPLTLDPTIMLTSNGVLNPLRQLASVSSITTTEWAGISSAGVTAGFAKEATEVGDNSPTLAQPKIKPEKAHSFVPFSIEAGQDWGGMRDELARLFADAKEVLEAEKFTSGDGTDEPAGIVTGASEVVATAEKGKFKIPDVYSTQEALPPRFQPRAKWLASNPISNLVYRFVGTDSEEPPLMNPDRTSILGKPYSEVSTMQASVAEAKVIAIYGDIQAGFKIVDRIGMNVELVPHLFGENGRPTGQRGLYAYWRVGSKVVVPNALRALKVKNT